MIGIIQLNIKHSDDFCNYNNINIQEIGLFDLERFYLSTDSLKEGLVL